VNGGALQITTMNDARSGNIIDYTRTHAHSSACIYHAMNGTFTGGQEFTRLPSCDIPVAWRTALQYTAVGSASVTLATALIYLALRLSVVKKKPRGTKILLGLIVLTITLAALRGALVLVYSVSSRTSIWMSILVGVLSATAIETLIWYVHIQLDLIGHFSIGRLGILLTHKTPLQLGFAVLVGIAFVVGSILVHVTTLRPHYMYWGAVVLGDMIIPYFCYIGIYIHREVRKTADASYMALAKRIYVSSIICGAIGAFTAATAIFSLFYVRIEWIAFELCWIAAPVFYLILFAIFVRRPVSKDLVRGTNRIAPAAAANDTSNTVPSFTTSTTATYIM